MKTVNIEYFDLSEKVIIHDNNLFERMKTLVQEKWEISNGVGISSVDMVAHNLFHGGLTNICRMYQYKFDDILNNMSYNYTYTH